MPIKMNKPGESSFGINIEDAFDAADDHTVELVDMDEFQGVSKLDGKPYTSIKWVFTIYDENGIAFGNLIDGGVFESWQFTSLSLATKSNGRAWASALLGHELTDAECDKIAEAFDTALVGKRAQASWKIEDDGKGNKRLKIALLRPLRKRAAAPQAEAAPEFIPREVVTAPIQPNGGRTRQTAAERRAALEAELAEEAAAADDAAPF